MSMQRDFATEKAMEYFEKVLDQIDQRKTDLEDTSKNLWNMTLYNNIEKIKAIYNTGANSIANDYFISELIKVQQEVYSDYPYVPKIKDHILNAIELFWIAVGKTSQHDQKQRDKSIDVAHEQISFSRKPNRIYYNKHQKEDIVEYEG